MLTIAWKFFSGLFFSSASMCIQGCAHRDNPPRTNINMSFKNMLGMISRVLMPSRFYCFCNNCCIEELPSVSPGPGWIPPSADGFYREKV